METPGRQDEPLTTILPPKFKPRRKSGRTEQEDYCLIAKEKKEIEKKGYCSVRPCPLVKKSPEGHFRF